MAATEATTICILQISAQQKVDIANSAFKNSTLLVDPVTKSPSNIRFEEGNYISLNSFFNEYKKTFGLSDYNDIKSFRVSSDKLGQTHHRYKQYYKGIELAEVQFILHEKNGMVFHANGTIIHDLDLDVTPSISEKDALQYALSNINAETYMWQNKKNEAYIKREQDNPDATMYPKGNLILSAKNFDIAPENFRLVYRFDIYAEKPMDRYYIDVDAKTGEIINKISKIETGDVPGQGTSFYNGVVSLTVADTAVNTINPSSWHLDLWNAYEGESWWIASPIFGDQGGYDNGWYEVLETDPISLTGSNINLEFYHRYKVEDPAGATTPYDGWDGMNVRISTDNGETWQVLQNPSHDYTNSSLYSFGEIYGEGSGIPGWAGELITWTNVSFDLTAYAGQNIKIRFAFASDLALSTNDEAPDLFGWQVDNIQVTNSSDTLYSNDGNVNEIISLNILQEASHISGNYRLRQYERGGGIATYDAKNGTFFPNSVDFIDNDTNFDSNNNRAGVSVHWALENTYDYYFNEHDRDSYDDNSGKIIAYAHYDDNYFNAFWDGSRTVYGDGTSNNTPLVSIDIVAHEFTHGVTDYTADLIYQNEPGALNESFSDIFGAAVEFYTLNTDGNWFIGEGGARLRSMSNPNQYGQPDTYLGQGWYTGTADNGGVHTNSGVQNFWYYLLSEGGTGTNDVGYSYSVDALGIDEASQIAYRNLSTYLVPSSEHDDARYGSILSAIDLFGDDSPQYEAVVEAWNAVGVLKPALVPTVATNSDTIDFLAEASATMDTVDVLISNFGLPVLEITDIQIVNGSAFQLLNVPAFPDSLDYDENLIIRILFTPDEEGEYTGTISVSSNDPVNPNKTVALNGTGYIINPAFDRVLYASSGPQNDGSILSLNKETGEGTNIGQSSYTDIAGLSINPVNKQLYAVRSNPIDSEIHRIDVIPGVSYSLFSFDLPNLAAIAFDTVGTLYGALSTGEIYSINAYNGSYNLVSTSAIEIQAMTFDPVTNELLATVRSVFGEPKDKTYKVDVNTGDTTFIGQTGFNTTTNDLAFDENGVLYGIKGTGSQLCDLFTIDVSTGEGTLVGPIGLRAITGLAYAETGVTDVDGNENTNELPEHFALLQNYPNPFNPATKIKFMIPNTEQVNLKVFDILGSEVGMLVNEKKPAGSYEINFDASKLSSGIYFYKLQAGSYTETKKMILLR